MNLKNYLGNGLALASGALVASSMLSVAPAQAASLSGVVNIAGATFLTNGNQSSPGTDTVKFSQGIVTADTTTGSFTSLVGTSVQFADVNLTKTNATSYTGTTATPFATFANGLSFSITGQPFEVLRVAAGNFRFGGTPNPVSGYFTASNGTTTLGNGILSFNSIRQNGSYSATIETVPEPLTILGSAAALGFGVAFKRKYAKKQNGKSLIA